MADRNKRIALYIIKTVREDTARGVESVPASGVVERAEEELNASGFTVRKTLWDLVDSDWLEFAEGRRIKLGSRKTAAEAP